MPVLSNQSVAVGQKSVFAPPPGEHKSIFSSLPFFGKTHQIVESHPVPVTTANPHTTVADLHPQQEPAFATDPNTSFNQRSGASIHKAQKTPGNPQMSSMKLKNPISKLLKHKSKDTDDDDLDDRDDIDDENDDMEENLENKPIIFLIPYDSSGPSAPPGFMCSSIALPAVCGLIQIKRRLLVTAFL